MKTKIEIEDSVDPLRAIYREVDPALFQRVLRNRAASTRRASQEYTEAKNVSPEILEFRVCR